MRVKATAKRAAVVAIAASCLVVLYFAGGALSPCPDDHPAWVMPLVYSGLWFAIVALCLPAHTIAVCLPIKSFWGGVVATCAIQGVLYFGVFLAVSELILWRKARREASR